MSVVNCKVAHIRPKYNNLKIWMEDSNNVYVGRQGVVFIKNDEGKNERFPKKSSIFSNPFKIGKDGDRNKVLKKYRKYMIENLDNNTLLQRELLKLKNKNLGCWCFPEPCHANILLELIELYENRY